jgi:hypothetical protein
MFLAGCACGTRARVCMCVCVVSVCARMDSKTEGEPSYLGLGLALQLLNLGSRSPIAQLGRGSGRGVYYHDAGSVASFLLVAIAVVVGHHAELVRVNGVLTRFLLRRLLTLPLGCFSPGVAHRRVLVRVCEQCTIGWCACA